MPDDPIMIASMPARARFEADARRRFVVCGDNPLAYRVVDELVKRYDASVCVLARSNQTNWAPQIGELPDVTVVTFDRLDEAAFTRAGLGSAEALALVNQDDAGNVDAALLAQEMNPALRLVIRMSNRSLGDRIGALINNCFVVSATGIAAPAFVAAALDDDATPPIQVADRALIATRRDRVRAEEVVCDLAIPSDAGDPELLPPTSHDRSDLVLARTKPTTAVSPRPPRRQLRLLPLVLSRRVRLVFAAFVALLAAGIATLIWVDEMNWAQAVYTALLTELGGANPDPDASSVQRVTLTVLTFVSVALIPLLTAAIVDAVVRARIRIEAGGLTKPMSDHTVVVGLGNLGTRVIRALHDQGVEVVAVERDPKARGVAVARELGLPVIIGDASRAESLQAASVATCRTLAILSTDDVTNLEAALIGRSVNPGVRVVVRLFDGDFADRVQRAFSINASRSVSYLAAPAFAAAMLGRQVIGTIPVQRRVLLLAELPIGSGSVLDNQPLRAVDRPHEVRVLALRAAPAAGQNLGPVLWQSPRDRRLSSTDHVIVVATRAGLGSLVSDLTTPADNPADPAAEMSERTDEARPIGPADAAPIRTA